MKRRDFLHTTALGGTFALTGTLAGCTTDLAPAAADATSVPPFELDEATVATLQEGMVSGRYTARDIVALYLRRIEEVDWSGPGLNAVLEVNPDAYVLAEALDEERRAGTVRGPLHGIPVLIKDNIDTADRMRTSAGSLALAEGHALQDAFVVQKLREAGAVILGKANLSEWANFRSSRSSSGWSGRGGQTNNPYALNRNPCGSSSGSGAGVSGNLCALAVGTETNGSIVCPSSANGVVGIKPTVGLVSRSGIIPISHTQDTAGPMTRTVTDAALLLGAMTGVDPRDPATKASEGQMLGDYTSYLDPNGLQGARIGVARAFFGFHEAVDAVMIDAIEAMRAKGAVIVDPVEIEGQGGLGRASYDVLLYEFKAGLNAYLAGRGDDVQTRTLAELIAFNEENRDREMPYFGQEIFIASEEKGPLTEQSYLDALETMQRGTREEGIDATLQAHNLDAIIAPTGGPAWVTDLVNGDHFGGGSSSPAARAGYPNITVPAGYVHGLPVGLSFFGTAYAEPTLIRLSYAFEQATQARRAPRFLPTANLSA